MLVFSCFFIVKLIYVNYMLAYCVAFFKVFLVKLI